MPTKSDLFQDGYVIIPNAVPAELCQAVVKDIDFHLSNGGIRHLGYGGMVEMYHYQSMWNVRQHPAVHAAFAELFGTENLWVSIDRCNFKMGSDDKTIREMMEGDNGFIHWDIYPSQRPRPFQVQGVVALTDTDPDMGGFQCIPEIYEQLDEMLDKSPNRKFRSPNLDLEGWKDKIVRPAMKAGDLLVWDSFLPHGNGVNRSDNPRYAMYVTMFPEGDDRLREERTECWWNNLPPSGWAFPGDPREIERRSKGVADLSELGLKLIGEERWE